MSKFDFGKIVNDLYLGFEKHSPEILTGLGITGMITTTIMAVKATPKALDVISDIKKKKHKNKKEETKEIVKKTAPLYLPSAVTCCVSAACIIGASTIHNKRNAALATAYTLSENALRNYKEKVIETIGPKKEQAIRDHIAEDRIKENPVTNNEVFITKAGDTLMYDCTSGRYFTGDIDKVKRIQNELNARLMQEMYISLNELYYELGLKPTSLGNEMGFNINDGLINMDFSAVITDDNRPCIYIDYTVGPRFGYGDLH